MFITTDEVLDPKRKLSWAVVSKYSAAPAVILDDSFMIDGHVVDKQTYLDVHFSRRTVTTGVGTRSSMNGGHLFIMIMVGKVL